MTSENANACILFANVCGSSRLYEKLGDTEAMHAVERCLKRMERATVAFGGRVVKAIGDEIMVHFEAPDDALLAACEMQHRVVDLPPVSGVKLSIRVGFAHGSVLDEKDDVTGEVVDMAAKISGLAQPGQIIATSDAAALFSASLHPLTRAMDDSNGPGLVEVLWRGSSGVTRKAGKTPVVVDLLKTALVLRHGLRELLLDEGAPVVTLGRDAHNDIVIRDPRASRNHGRIERRNDKYVIVDQSTNGTYVSIDGEVEVILKREEAVLRGRGRLYFGHQHGNQEGADDEAIEFELIRQGSRQTA